MDKQIISHSKKKCKHGFPLFQSCSKCGRNMVCSPFCDTKHDSFTECNSNNTPPQKHTTHYACKEVMERDGGKAVGCCCTGHKCKEQEEDLSGLVIGPGTTKKQESGEWEEKLSSKNQIIEYGFDYKKLCHEMNDEIVKLKKDLQEAERRGMKKVADKITEMMFSHLDDFGTFDFEGFGKCVDNYIQDIKKSLKKV